MLYAEGVVLQAQRSSGQLGAGEPSSTQLRHGFPLGRKQRHNALPHAVRYATRRCHLRGRIPTECLWWWTAFSTERHIP